MKNKKQQENNNSEDLISDKLEKIIAKSKNENEALRKILKGLADLHEKSVMKTTKKNSKKYLKS